MKHRRGIFLLSCALIVLLSAGTAMAEVVRIGTESDLAAFRDRVNNGEVTLDAELTADIRLTKNWVPIGQHIIGVSHDILGRSFDIVEHNYSYNGMFNGNGHSIYSLIVTEAEATEYLDNPYWRISIAGLFGATGPRAVIKNLTIQCSEVSANGEASAVGAVAGVNHGTISGVDVMGGKFSGYDTGGIAGWALDGVIMNSRAHGQHSITGGSSGTAGGLVGDNRAGITNSSAMDTKAITAFRAGGIAGQNDGDVLNATAGNIRSIVGYNAGGIVGVTGEFCTDEKPASIINCLAMDIWTINGGGNAGGVVGFHEHSSLTMNSGLVTVNKATTLSSESKCQEGGVVGELIGVVSLPLHLIQNCFYASNTIFTHEESKPIGNVPLEAMNPRYNVGVYDVTADPEGLPAILAELEQGISLTVELGKPFHLDVTTLPGKAGIEEISFAWESANANIVTVSPANGPAVTVTGVALGTANLTCKITGEINTTLTCVVRVVASDGGNTPDGDHSGSGGGCSTASFALFALAALPFLARKK